MLSNATQRSATVDEQKLPVTSSECEKKSQLSEDKFGVNGDSVHFSNGLVVLVMRDWCLDNHFTHVVIVVIISEHHTLVDAFLVVWGVVEWSTNGYLQGSGQTSEHQTANRLDSEIKLFLSLPVVANHDGEVRV